MKQKFYYRPQGEDITNDRQITTKLFWGGVAIFFKGFEKRLRKGTNNPIRDNLDFLS
jgi:hypothetical protein